MRLAHCPFCGEEERLEVISTLNQSPWCYHVTCNACDTRGPHETSTDRTTSKQTAINSWNNRLSHHDDLALRVAFALTETATGPGA